MQLVLGIIFLIESVELLFSLKLYHFIKGNSGVSLDLVNHLITFLNYNCLPLIPSQGSVGASGDLAPLSHMTLSLMGIGKSTIS